MEKPDSPVQPKSELINKRTCSGKVLLVEDSNDLALIMDFMLSRLGFEVKVLKNWEGVLETLENENIDLVLLDIGLPEVDGYDIAKLIRSNEHYTHLPLVALTGYDSLEHKKMAKEAGFNMHLTKPVSADRLAEALSSLLNL